MVQLPALVSMQSLYMQPVMSSSGAVFTMAMDPPVSMRQGIQSLPTSAVTAVNQTLPQVSVDLYLCNTSKNATGLILSAFDINLQRLDYYILCTE